LITARDLKPFLPDGPLPSNLPVLVSHGSTASNGYVSESTFANERDILYKVIFDMKKDMNEMKRMFLELVQNPQSAATHSMRYSESMLHESQAADASLPIVPASQPSQGQPFIIQHSAPQAGYPSAAQSFDQHEEVEESLNLLDMEKDLIIRALKKHRSKRKDAALDLGISERTLYRKLKEYDIEDL
jgi:DNA-binding protein Fis